MANARMELAEGMVCEERRDSWLKGEDGLLMLLVRDCARDRLEE